MSKLNTEFGVYIGIDDGKDRWRGCGVGVRNLLRRSFEKQDWTIFAEDDADFDQAGLDKLENAVKQLNDAGIQWDMIVGTMAGFYGQVLGQPVDGLEVYQVNQFSSCVLNAYNKSVMREFENYNENAGQIYTNTYDKFLSQKAAEGKLKIFAITPFVSSCLHVESTMWKNGESKTGYEKFFKESSVRFETAISNMKSIQIFTSFTEGYDAPRNDIQFIKPKSKHKNPAKDVGEVKWKFWEYGIDSEFSMWVDGSIYPLAAPEEYIKLLGDADIALFQHPWRDCIYDEIDETLKLGFDLPEIALPMKERFLKAGYPAHNGLGETGVMIRRNTPLVKQFCKALWKEIAANSHRDQLAFNYVLSKFKKLKVLYMPPSVRTHPMFKMINHQKHVHKVDGKLIARSI
tara:strand:- start:425 stop:1630 length:1206 start_codon:yes stop_codon:yes gene_type:complete